MESRAEYADIQVAACVPGLLQLQKEINMLLPHGLEIMEIREMQPPAGSLSVQIKGFSYDITIPPDAAPDLSGLREKIVLFLQSPTVIITRETKDKKVAKDIRPFVSDLAWDAEKNALTLRVLISPMGTVRPLEILTQVLGISSELAWQARIVKTETYWAEGQ